MPDTGTCNAAEVTAELAAAKAAATTCFACPLQVFEICRRLSLGGLMTASPGRDRVSLARGESIPLGEAHGGDLYIVITGAVKLLRSLPDGRNCVVALQLPGNLVPQALGETLRGLEARAATATTLCRIRHDALARIRAQDPLIDRKLLELMQIENRSLLEHVCLLGHKTPLERVAGFLLRLRDVQRQRGLPSEILELPVQRADIAAYLGLQIETVSRAFSRLSAEEIIDRSRPRRISILDLPRLEALVVTPAPESGRVRNRQNEAAVRAEAGA